MYSNVYVGLPRWLSGKESACQCRRHKRHGFDPWVRKIPWSRKWQPTPVFLPGKVHGPRSLVGYSSWDCREVDTTEPLSTCVYSSINYNSMICKQLNCSSTDEWVKTMYVCMMLSDISQTEANTVWCHLHMESKEYNKLVNITKKKQTLRYREQTSGYQWEEGSGRGNIVAGD